MKKLINLWPSKNHPISSSCCVIGKTTKTNPTATNRSRFIIKMHFR